MLVMIIPVLAVLLPLFKVLPPLYQWTERSKIYRWYRAVKSVENRSLRSDSSAALNALHAELNSIENKASKTAVSLAYTDQLYNLRMHINLVRSYIDEELTKHDPKQE
jgi:hypothetical protein